MIQYLERHKQKCMALLWVALVLASVKSIFTDTGYDNAYIVAMSFRHLRGDRMFEQMWEPHQTSIFFTDLFMWIYHFFVPSYAGVMIYLQIVGTFFFALIGFLIYKLLRETSGSDVARFAAIFFIMFRAKQTPFPDFANLQTAFSTLLFLCLVTFVSRQEKRRYLCLAAIFLCLEVLAYPSCLLAYFPVALILFLKTRERWKNIGLFTGVCVLLGGAYVGYFLCRIGSAAFFRNLANIFYADSHSGEEWVSRWNYFSGIITAVSWLALCAVLTQLMVWCGTLRKKRLDFFAVYGFVLFFSEIFLLFLQERINLDWTCSFYIIPAFLMALGCFSFRDLDEREKTVWLTGSLLAICSFLSAYLLTDLGLITMAAYMALGGVVSLTALRHRKKQIWIFLFLICALVTMHRGLVVWGYANKAKIWMVQDVQTIIRSGPSAGIVCDYKIYNQITCDAEDHNQFISSEDSLLLVGGWLIDSMEFLLTDADISNPSTIDTPIYNERLLDYLTLYPEKKPTVVAVGCWNDSMVVPEDSWIMQWVNAHYEPVGDGRYWRYYRAK